MVLGDEKDTVGQDVCDYNLNNNESLSSAIPSHDHSRFDVIENAFNEKSGNDQIEALSVKDDERESDLFFSQNQSYGPSDCEVPSVMTSPSTKPSQRTTSKSTPAHPLEDNDDINQSNASSSKTSPTQGRKRIFLCLSSPHNGADLYKRMETASRSALGAFTVFAVLVLTDQMYLQSIWIGNIFMHVCLKDNLGATIRTSYGYARSIVATTIFSWPLAYLLNEVVKQEIALWLLPPLTFVSSLFLFFVPNVTSPNLMILVWYVNVATPIRQRGSQWWQPIGSMGSYLFGIAVAILMHMLVPKPWKWNTATSKASHILKRSLHPTFAVLMQEIYNYTKYTGNNPQKARKASAAIHLSVQKLDKAIQTLKSVLPDIKEEDRWCVYGFGRNNKAYDRLAQWVAHLQTLQTKWQRLALALNQRYLGETVDSTRKSTVQLRRLIYESLQANGYEEVCHSLGLIFQECNAQAHPPLQQEQEAYLSSPSSTEHDGGTDDVSFQTVRPTGSGTTLDAATHTSTIKTVQHSMVLIQQAFATAIHQAAVQSQQEDVPPIPIFAHVARRLTSFHSFMTLGNELIRYHDKTLGKGDNNNNADERGSQEASANDASKNRSPQSHRTMASILQRSGRALLHSVQSMYKTPWLWHSQECRRLAFKTATGMVLASLWISVDALWEIAAPFGWWPGLTVASVNLATTGSSFHKAVDRMIGTLFAAAYSLLIVDFFGGTEDAAKIPAIAFGVMYMKRDDHDYAFQYAATSVGSMLYGSIQNNFDLQEYIPKRIELIFVGVITFAIVELMLFPRSSRELVEEAFLRFFDVLQSFLKIGSDYGDSIEVEVQSIRMGRTELISQTIACIVDEAALMDKRKKDLNDTVAIIKKELPSAFLEPYFGFANRLDHSSLIGLFTELQGCNTQADSLTAALNRIKEMHATQQSIVFQEIDWTQAFATSLGLVSAQMQTSCEALKQAFPDGRLRPQTQHSASDASAAAATFRDFGDIQYQVISIWTSHFQQFHAEKKSTATANVSELEEILLLGITTSYIMELSKHLQRAGKELDAYARTFLSPM